MITRHFFFVTVALFIVQHGNAQTFTEITSGDIILARENSLGGGWADHNNDGYVDLFVARWYVEPDALFTNNGNGTFTRVTEGDLVNDDQYGVGVAWGDYDNDGWDDLFLTAPNTLYHNNGDGTFTGITEGDIVNDTGVPIGCAWGDYDNDGDLDLFVANHEYTNDFLYRNEGDGSFTSVLTGPVVNDAASSNTGRWCDYDNDGYLDLFVACYFGEINLLYHNNGDGTFSKVTAGDIVHEASYSVGCAWGDYDKDGDFDLFVANENNQNNFLYQNNGDGTFTKITSGVVVNDGGASRGCAWGDYDNDGDIDLFVANSGNQTNVLYTNNGDGTFTKVTDGDVVNTTSYWQDCSWTDYDHDGALDLFVTNPSTLYHNEGNSNHWIVIHCIGTFSNRSAVGTRVSIQANTGDWQYQALMGATGRCSQSDPNIHVGLGSATSIAEMRVTWPASGIVQVFQNISADQYITVVEPVQPAIAALIDRVQELVTSGVLSHGRGNGLTSKLEAAIRQSDRGNDHTVINQLHAFTNQVNAFISSGKLTSQAGQRLLDAANRIVAALQVVNGFAKRGGAEQPATFFLGQNYPNPFNPSTTINYQLPTDCRVTLKIYDLLGREVATLVNEVQNAGFKSVRFDASGLATGVYLYRLQAGDLVETKRFVLLR